MKQWLKIILITLALFVSFNANAQNFITVGPGNYGKWLLSNESCYGCGSFYIMVTNTYNAVDGLYYYDIYLWSNGYTANTYIKSVNIYALNLNRISENLVLSFQYLVVPPKSYQFNGYFYVGYVYSTSSTQKIKFDWQSASAWQYGKR